MYYKVLICLFLDQIYGIHLTPEVIDMSAYLIDIGTEIPNWVGVSGETKICFLVEAQKFGVPIQMQPQAMIDLAPHIKDIQGYAEAITSQCSTFRHPWAKNQIAANLAVRLYKNRGLSSGDFLAAVYNHKMCDLDGGLLLRPLRTRTGFVSVDFQGMIGFASCEKWRIGLEKLGNMPEAAVIENFWKVNEAEIKALCLEFSRRISTR